MSYFKDFIRFITLATFFIGVASFSLANQKDEKPWKDISISIDKNYLLVPMSPKSDYRKFKITAPSGEIVGSYEGLLTAGNGDWQGDIDVSALKGKVVKFSYQDDGSGDPKITQVDLLPIKSFSEDRGRPKYHFTPKYGWLNDPNGLIYFNGKWHMFHQFNPFSLDWKPPMHWGHAVSDNLLHWSYKKNAINPKFSKTGSADQAFSGTAYYDKTNRSKLFSSSKGGVIFAYTSTGRGECIMISEDLENFKEVSFNPIITAAGRDPRIFFNEDSGKWTLIRYEEDGKAPNIRKFFAIYISDDLKKWEKTDEIANKYECPDMFKMPVIGSNEKPKWVVLEASGQYVVGDFDGRKFTQISKKPQRFFYGDAYATQIWQNDPKGRILATAWVRQPSNIIRAIGQNFSQGMSLPWELRLVKLRNGDFQIRTAVIEEVTSRYGRPINLLENPMSFSSNIFEMPNAGSNNCMYECVAKITNAFRMEVGTASVRYTTPNNSYHVFRIDSEKHSQEAQAPKTDLVSVRTFVDTYTCEMQFNDGEAVVMIGDSYLNPQQTIKIGGVGFTLIELFNRRSILHDDYKKQRKDAQKRYQNFL